MNTKDRRFIRSVMARALRVVGAGALVTSAIGCTRAKSSGQAASAASPAFSLVTLERRPCFGTCPVYLVSIASDGAVTFDGRKHVQTMGKGTARISAEQVTALQGLIDAHDFYALDDKYAMGEANCRSYATDAPTVIISVTTKDRVKRVEHDLGCGSVPPRLSDLEQKIDQLANVAQFIGEGRK